MEGKFADTTNQLANTWTNARRASRRQGVTWSFSDGLPTIIFGDDRLTASKRRGIMRALHGHFQLKETTKLLQYPSQGKAMDCVAMSPSSSHFITDGMFTRFADWRFIHKARLNLDPLNDNKSWQPKELRACRKCGKWDKTLPHVLNHCTLYSAAWQLRQNAVLARIRSAVAFKGTVLSENQRKVEKYAHLIRHFTDLGFQSVKILPIGVGSLGAWDPENNLFLKLAATKRYLKTLRKLCVSDCIRWSREIYIQHLTGVQQYTENFLPHPDPVATEESCSHSTENVNSQCSHAAQMSTNNSPDINSPTEIAPSSSPLPTVGGGSESTDL
ncbi:retrovirus-related Pol polyprotein from type-2 retrotransposable element R2DM [Trichonephila clavipes]|nr:retrovirus-related Pol polyprotein from type-2 retrotransposable element R2DM [Trichonephila clavipes]